MQMYRNRRTKDARCGPHFSFVDPFVTVENYPVAADLLKEKLANFPAFQVKLAKFGSFKFSKTSVLFLEPEFEPPTALQDLLKEISSVFPQCNDQILKSKNGSYVAHMTIGTYTSTSEMEKDLAEIKKQFVPITFTVDEIYLLNRIGFDPFEVKYAIPLKGRIDSQFGPGCLDEKLNTKANRTIVVMGIPDSLTNDKLAKLFLENGFIVDGAEMILNPDGRARAIGVVEFPSREEADRAVVYTNKELSSKLPTTAISIANNKEVAILPYAKPLTHMVFPDVVGGSCSTSQRKGLNAKVLI